VGTVASSGTFAARSAALRDTAKWIAAAFSGAGAAVLFSGLAFTNTTRTALVDGWLLATVLATLPLLAAAAAVASAVRVVNSQARPVEQLVPRFAKAQLGIDGKALKATERATIMSMVPDVTTRYGDIDVLDQQLITAYDDMRAARSAYAKGRTPAQRENLADATQRFEVLQSGLSELVEASEYVRVRRRHRQALSLMLPAALVAVAAVAAAGVQTGRAERSAATQRDAGQSATVQRPVAVILAFEGGAATLEALPLHCIVGNGTRAVAIGGTYTRPVLVMNPPSASASASASAAVPSAPSAPGGPPTCATTWIWRPEPGRLTAVPLDPSAGG
jgi:hypothetical protein